MIPDNWELGATEELYKILGLRETYRRPSILQPVQE